MSFTHHTGSVPPSPERRSRSCREQESCPRRRHCRDPRRILGRRRCCCPYQFPSQGAHPKSSWAADFLTGSGRRSRARGGKDKRSSMVSGPGYVVFRWTPSDEFRWTPSVVPVQMSAASPLAKHFKLLWPGDAACFVCWSTSVQSAF